MKTTIRDVAKVAGVSPMAVSSVLHGTGKNVRVSEATAARIREVAEQLHYRPNTFARNLRTGKTHTIGVVMRNFMRFPIRDHYYQHVFNGIMSSLFPAQYTLALCPDLTVGQDAGAMIDGRYDGILWARPDFSGEVLTKLKSYQLPTVLLHAPLHYTNEFPTFTGDNRDGLMQVAKHFAKLGHKDVAYVTFRPVDSSIEDMERWFGFETECNSLGLSCERFQWDKSNESIIEFRKNFPQKTALAFFSDTLALSFLDACLELKISVPQEYSIAGFDSIPQCDEATPKLTSVYQPLEEMAFEAAQCLLNLISKPDLLETSSNLSQVFPCTLQIRESTTKK